MIVEIVPHNADKGGGFRETKTRCKTVDATMKQHTAEARRIIGQGQRDDVNAIIEAAQQRQIANTRELRRPATRAYGYEEPAPSRVQQYEERQAQQRADRLAGRTPPPGRDGGRER